MADCINCGAPFRLKRKAQLYCSPACRKAAWHKANRSVATAEGVSPQRRSVAAAVDAPGAALAPYVWPCPPRGIEELNRPTPGALQGDDVQLEYYEDGYPKLPACLDRRPIKLAEAA